LLWILWKEAALKRSGALDRCGQTVFGVIGFLLFLLPATQTTAAVAIRDVTRNLLLQDVVIEGELTAYAPPRTSRAPHAFMLKDATGIIRVCIWSDVFDKIPNRAMLRPGASVRAKVRVAEYRGNIEGHVEDPAGIQLTGTNVDVLASHRKALAALPGFENSTTQTFSRVAVLSVGQINWHEDVQEAMAAAKQQNRKILVFFRNSTADISRHVEDSVLGDMRVRTALQQRFIALRIDTARNPAIARQLGVYRPGIINIYGPDGKFQKQIVSLNTAEDFLRHLE
jgi:hypothetical protein